MRSTALGMFQGPDLIVVHVNDELVRLTGDTEVIGFPAREVWFDAESRETQELMLATMRDGRPRAIGAVDCTGCEGMVTIERVSPDRVVTAWVPRQGLRPEDSAADRRSRRTASARR